MISRTYIYALFPWLLLSCGEAPTEGPPVALDYRPAAGLVFEREAPKQTLLLRNTGGFGFLCLRRVSLADENTGFRLLSGLEDLPLGGAEPAQVEVEVDFENPNLENGELIIEYSIPDVLTPAEDLCRVGEAQRARVSLWIYLVGPDPHLVVPEREVRFISQSGVPVQASFEVENGASTGNRALALDFQSTTPEVRIVSAPKSLLPMARGEVVLEWEAGSEVLQGERILVNPDGPAPQSAELELTGTTVPGIRIRTDPTRIDLGSIPAGSPPRALPVVVSNLGRTLWSFDVEVRSRNGGLVPIYRGPPELRVGPLGRVSVDFEVDPAMAGEMDAEIILRGLAGPERIRIPVTGRSCNPSLEVSDFDFGSIATGVTYRRNIVVRNAGVCELTIASASVPGMQSSFRVVDFSGVVLDTMASAVIPVEVTLNGAGALEGVLEMAVEGEAQPTQIRLFAFARRCEEVCPVANGVGMCLSTGCEVGRCDRDFYDLDGDPSACETAEPTLDAPDRFGLPGGHMGRVEDNDTPGTRLSYTGILPTTTDVDHLSAFTKDTDADIFGEGLSGEKFCLDVALGLSNSADASFVMEVFRDNHEQDNFQGCGGPRTKIGEVRGGPGVVHVAGRTVHDDDSDICIKVSRETGFGPTPTEFTVDVILLGQNRCRS